MNDPIDEIEKELRALDALLRTETGTAREAAMSQLMFMIRWEVFYQSRRQTTDEEVQAWIRVVRAVRSAIEETQTKEDQTA